MATVLPNVMQYSKNLIKSTLYATDDVVGKLMPGYADFKDTNKDVFKAAYVAIRDYRKTFQKARDAFFRSRIYEAADVGIKNLKEDLATGNWYNKSREVSFESKTMEETMGGSEFDIDESVLSGDKKSGGGDDGLGDLDSLLGDDSEFDTDESQLDISDGDALVAKTVEETGEKAAGALANVQVKSVDALMKSNRVNANVLYIQNEKMMKIQEQGFSTLTETTANILKFNTEGAQKHFENSASFYTESQKLLTEQNAMVKELVEMQRNIYRMYQIQEEKKEDPNKKKKKYTYGDIVTSTGIPQIEEYIEAIGQNFVKTMDDLGGGMYSQLFGDDSMLGKNPLLQFVQNPLGGVMTLLVTTALGPKLQEAAKSLDSTVSGLFGSFIGKMNRFAEEGEGGPLGILGSILGIRDTAKNSISSENYKRGPMPWDGEAKKALTEVIPHYLANIEAALTGNPHQLFDYQSGKYIETAGLWKQYEDTIDRYKGRAFGDLDEIVSDILTSTKRNYDEDMALKKDYLKLKNYWAASKGRFQKTFSTNLEDEESLSNLYYDAGLSSEENLKYLVNAIKRATAPDEQNNIASRRGLLTSIEGKIMDARIAQTKEFQNMEDNGSIMTQLFNNGYTQRYDRKTKELLNANSLSKAMHLKNMTDSKGRNIFYFLEGIYAELMAIRVEGFGVGNWEDFRIDPTKSKAKRRAKKKPQTKEDRSKEISLTEAKYKETMKYADRKEEQTPSQKYNEDVRKAREKYDARISKMMEERKKRPDKYKDISFIAPELEGQMMDDAEKIHLEALEFEKQIERIRQERIKEMESKKSFIGKWWTGVKESNKKKYQEQYDDIEKNGFLQALINAGSIGDKWGVIRVGLEKLTEKPSAVLTKALQQADERIYKFFFEDEEVKDKQTGEVARGFFGRMKIELKNMFFNLNEGLNKYLFEPLKAKLGVEGPWDAIKKGLMNVGIDVEGLQESAKEKWKDLSGPIWDRVKEVFGETFKDAIDSIEEEERKAREKLGANTDETIIGTLRGSESSTSEQDQSKKETKLKIDHERLDEIMKNGTLEEKARAVGISEDAIASFMDNDTKKIKEDMKDQLQRKVEFRYAKLKETSQGRQRDIAAGFKSASDRMIVSSNLRDIEEIAQSSQYNYDEDQRDKIHKLEEEINKLGSIDERISMYETILRGKTKITAKDEKAILDRIAFLDQEADRGLDDLRHTSQMGADRGVLGDTIIGYNRERNKLKEDLKKFMPENYYDEFQSKLDELRREKEKIDTSTPPVPPIENKPNVKYDRFIPSIQDQLEDEEVEEINKRRENIAMQGYREFDRRVDENIKRDKLDWVADTKDSIRSQLEEFMKNNRDLVFDRYSKYIDEFLKNKAGIEDKKDREEMINNLRNIYIRDTRRDIKSFFDVRLLRSTIQKYMRKREREIRGELQSQLESGEITENEYKKKLRQTAPKNLKEAYNTLRGYTGNITQSEYTVDDKVLAKKDFEEEDIIRDSIRLDREEESKKSNIFDRVGESFTTSISELDTSIRNKLNETITKLSTTISDTGKSIIDKLDDVISAIQSIQISTPPIGQAAKGRGYLPEENAFVSKGEKIIPDRGKGVAQTVQKSGLVHLNEGDVVKPNSPSQQIKDEANENRLKSGFINDIGKGQDVSKYIGKYAKGREDIQTFESKRDEDKYVDDIAKSISETKITTPEIPSYAKGKVVSIESAKEPSAMQKDFIKFISDYKEDLKKGTLSEQGSAKLIDLYEKHPELAPKRQDQMSDILSSLSSKLIDMKHDKYAIDTLGKEGLEEVKAKLSQRAQEFRIREAGTYLEQSGLGKNVIQGVNNIKEGTTDFFTRLLGVDSKKVKEATQETYKEIKKGVPDVIAHGALGTVGGLFLGGPLVGAILGSAVGFVRSSETVQEALFGKKIKDKDGNVTRDDSGFFGQEIQNTFKQYFPSMKNLGIVGGIAGLITPFGPLGGALIGAGIGALRANESFQKAFFGDKEGLVNKKTRDFLKKAAPNMAASALGMALLGPFGLVGNLAVGAGLGLAGSTEEFKTFVFGAIDKRTGKRNGGIVGALKEGIVDPWVDFGKKVKDDLFDWIKKDVFGPLKGAMFPIAKQFQLGITGLLKGIGSFFNHWTEVILGRPIAALIRDKFMKPFSNAATSILNGILKPAKWLLSRPSKIIGGIGDILKRRQVQMGNADYMSAADRLRFREESGMDMTDDYAQFDTVLASASNKNISSILKTTKLLKNKDKKKAKDQAVRELWATIDNNLKKTITGEDVDIDMKVQISNLLRSDNPNEYQKGLQMTRKFAEENLSVKDRESLFEAMRDADAQVQATTKNLENDNDAKAVLADRLKETFGLKTVDTENIDKIISMFEKEESVRRRQEEKIEKGETGQGADALLEATQDQTSQVVAELNNIGKILKQIQSEAGSLTLDQEKQIQSNIAGWDLIRKESKEEQVKRIGDVRQALYDIYKDAGEDYLKFDEAAYDKMSNPVETNPIYDIIDMGRRGFKAGNLNKLLQQDDEIIDRIIKLFNQTGRNTDDYEGLGKLDKDQFQNLLDAAAIGLRVTNLEDFKDLDRVSLQRIKDARDLIGVDESRISNKTLIDAVLNQNQDAVWRANNTNVQKFLDAHPEKIEDKLLLKDATVVEQGINSSLGSIKREDPRKSYYNRFANFMTGIEGPNVGKAIDRFGYRYQDYTLPMTLSFPELWNRTYLADSTKSFLDSGYMTFFDRHKDVDHKGKIEEEAGWIKDGLEDLRRKGIPDEEIEKILSIKIEKDDKGQEQIKFAPSYGKFKSEKEIVTDEDNKDFMKMKRDQMVNKPEGYGQGFTDIVERENLTEEEEKNYREKLGIQLQTHATGRLEDNISINIKSLDSGVLDDITYAMMDALEAKESGINRDILQEYRAYEPTGSIKDISPDLKNFIEMSLAQKEMEQETQFRNDVNVGLYNARRREILGEDSTDSEDYSITSDPRFIKFLDTAKEGLFNIFRLIGPTIIQSINDSMVSLATHSKGRGTEYLDQLDQEIDENLLDLNTYSSGRRDRKLKEQRYLKRKSKRIAERKAKKIERQSKVQEDVKEDLKDAIVEIVTEAAEEIRDIQPEELKEDIKVESPTTKSAEVIVVPEENITEVSEEVKDTKPEELKDDVKVEAPGGKKEEFIELEGIKHPAARSVDGSIIPTTKEGKEAVENEEDKTESIKRTPTLLEEIKDVMIKGLLGEKKEKKDEKKSFWDHLKDLLKLLGAFLIGGGLATLLGALSNDLTGAIGKTFKGIFEAGEQRIVAALGEISRPIVGIKDWLETHIRLPRNPLAGIEAEESRLAGRATSQVAKGVVEKGGAEAGAKVAAEANKNKTFAQMIEEAKAQERIARLQGTGATEAQAKYITALQSGAEASELESLRLAALKDNINSIKEAGRKGLLSQEEFVMNMKSLNSSISAEELEKNIKDIYKGTIREDIRSLFDKTASQIQSGMNKSGIINPELDAMLQNQTRLTGSGNPLLIQRQDLARLAEEGIIKTGRGIAYVGDTLSTAGRKGIEAGKTVVEGVSNVSSVIKDRAIGMKDSVKRIIMGNPNITPEELARLTAELPPEEAEAILKMVKLEQRGLLGDEIRAISRTKDRITGAIGDTYSRAKGFVGDVRDNISSRFNRGPVQIQPGLTEADMYNNYAAELERRAQVAAEAAAQSEEKGIFSRMAGISGEALAKGAAVTGAVGGGLWSAMRSAERELAGFGGSIDNALADRYGMKYRIGAFAPKMVLGMPGFAMQSLEEAAGLGKGIATMNASGLTNFMEAASKAGERVAVGTEAPWYKQVVNKAAFKVDAFSGKVFPLVSRIVETVFGAISRCLSVIPGLSQGKLVKFTTEISKAFSVQFASKAGMTAALGGILSKCFMVYFAAELVKAFYDGMANPGEFLHVSNNDKIPTGIRVAAALSNVFSHVFLGLISPKTIASFMVKHVGSLLGFEEEVEQFEQEQQESDKAFEEWKAQDETRKNATFKEYMQAIGTYNNKGVVENVADFIATGVRDFIGDLPKFIIQKIGDLGSGIFNIGKYVSDLGQYWNRVSDVSSQMFHGVLPPEQIKQMADSLAVADDDPLKGIKETIRDFASNHWFIMGTVGWLIGKFTDGVGKVISGVGNTVVKMKNTAVGMIEGAIEGDPLKVVQVAYEDQAGAGDAGNGWLSGILSKAIVYPLAIPTLAVSLAVGGFKKISSFIDDVSSSFEAVPQGSKLIDDLLPLALDGQLGQVWDAPNIFTTAESRGGIGYLVAGAMYSIGKTFLLPVAAVSWVGKKLVDGLEDFVSWASGTEFSLDFYRNYEGNPLDSEYLDHSEYNFDPSHPISAVPSIVETMYKWTMMPFKAVSHYLGKFLEGPGIFDKIQEKIEGIKEKFTWISDLFDAGNKNAANLQAATNEQRRQQNAGNQKVVAVGDGTTQIVAGVNKDSKSIQNAISTFDTEFKNKKTLDFGGITGQSLKEALEKIEQISKNKDLSEADKNTQIQEQRNFIKLTLSAGANTDPKVKEKIDKIKEKLKEGKAGITDSEVQDYIVEYTIETSKNGGKVINKEEEAGKGTGKVIAPKYSFALKDSNEFQQNRAGFDKIPYTVEGDTQVETLATRGCGPEAFRAAAKQVTGETLNEFDEFENAKKDIKPNDGTDFSYFRRRSKELGMGLKETTNITDIHDAVMDPNKSVITMTQEKGQSPHYKTKEAMLTGRGEKLYYKETDPESATKVASDVKHEDSITKKGFIFGKGTQTPVFGRGEESLTENLEWMIGKITDRVNSDIQMSKNIVVKSKNTLFKMIDATFSGDPIKVLQSLYEDQQGIDDTRGGIPAVASKMLLLPLTGALIPMVSISGTIGIFNKAEEMIKQVSDSLDAVPQSAQLISGLLPLALEGKVREIWDAQNPFANSSIKDGPGPLLAGAIYGIGKAYTMPIAAFNWAGNMMKTGIEDFVSWASGTKFSLTWYDNFNDNPISEAYMSHSEYKYDAKHPMTAIPSVVETIYKWGSFPLKAISYYLGKFVQGNGLFDKIKETVLSIKNKITSITSIFDSNDNKPTPTTNKPKQFQFTPGVKSNITPVQTQTIDTINLAIQSFKDFVSFYSTEFKNKKTLDIEGDKGKEISDALDKIKEISNDASLDDNKKKEKTNQYRDTIKKILSDNEVDDTFKEKVKKAKDKIKSSKPNVTDTNIIEYITEAVIYSVKNDNKLPTKPDDLRGKGTGQVSTPKYSFSLKESNQFQQNRAGFDKIPYNVKGDTQVETLATRGCGPESLRAAAKKVLGRDLDEHKEFENAKRDIRPNDGTDFTYFRRRSKELGMGLKETTNIRDIRKAAADPTKSVITMTQEKGQSPHYKNKEGLIRGRSGKIYYKETNPEAATKVASDATHEDSITKKAFIFSRGRGTKKDKDYRLEVKDFDTHEMITQGAIKSKVDNMEGFGKGTDLANYDVTRDSGFRADDLKPYTKGSPELEGKEEYLVNKALSCGLDPAVMAAIPGIECSWGKAQTGKLYYARQGDPDLAYFVNNVYSIEREGERFPTVESNIDYANELIRDDYVSKGKKTIRDIGNIYCPPGAENDPNGTNNEWVPYVANFVKENAKTLEGPSLVPGQVASPTSNGQQTTGVPDPSTPGEARDPEAPAGLPFFKMWDDRWADKPFPGGSNNPLAYCGCGPTSLAMVSTWATGDIHLPDEVAKWVGERGGHVSGGIDWSFFDKYAKEHGGWGFKQTDSFDTVKTEAFQKGYPVLNSQGPGEFTQNGHMITLAGMRKDGSVIVYDPNKKGPKDGYKPEDITSTNAGGYWIPTGDNIGTKLAFGDGATPSQGAGTTIPQDGSSGRPSSMLEKLYNIFFGGDTGGINTNIPTKQDSKKSTPKTLSTASDIPYVKGEGYEGGRIEGTSIYPMVTPVNRISIHHSGTGQAGTDLSAEELDYMHTHPDENDKSKPWSAIGYHFVVRKDGTVERGRKEKYQGAHTYDDETGTPSHGNIGSIGIHVSGDFNKESPTEPQLKSLTQLVTDVGTKYKIPFDREHIRGHYEWSGGVGTNWEACPGMELSNKLDSIVEEAKTTTPKVTASTPELGKGTTRVYSEERQDVNLPTFKDDTKIDPIKDNNITIQKKLQSQKDTLESKISNKVKGITVEGQTKLGKGSKFGRGNVMRIDQQSGPTCTSEATRTIYRAYLDKDIGVVGSGAWAAMMDKISGGEDQHREINFNDKASFDSKIQQHFDTKPDHPVLLYQTGGAGSGGGHKLNRGSGNHATVIGRRVAGNKYEVYDSNGGMVHTLSLDELYDPTAKGDQGMSSGNAIWEPTIEPTQPIDQWQGTGEPAGPQNEGGITSKDQAQTGGPPTDKQRSNGVMGLIDKYLFKGLEKAFDQSGLKQAVKDQYNVDLGSFGQGTDSTVTTTPEMIDKFDAIKESQANTISTIESFTHNIKPEKQQEAIKLFNQSQEGKDFNRIEAMVDRFNRGKKYKVQEIYESDSSDKKDKQVQKFIKGKKKIEQLQDKYGKGTYDSRGDANQRRDYIWSWLTDPSKGALPPAGAAGIMGNIAVESGYTYDPQIVEDGTYANEITDTPMDGAPGYGIFQFTSGDNKKGLLDWATKKGVSTGTIDPQLEFVKWYTTEGGESWTKAWENAQKAEDPAKATDQFMNDYERPGVTHVEERTKAGKEIYEAYSGKTIPGGSDPTNSGGTKSKGNTPSASGVMGLVDKYLFTGLNKAFEQSGLKQDLKNVYGIDMDAAALFNGSIETAPSSTTPAVQTTPGETTPTQEGPSAGNAGPVSGNAAEAMVKYEGNAPITSPYGYREHPVHGGRKLHGGIDIGIDEGTPVYTPVSGIVDCAEAPQGVSDGYGNLVVVKDSKNHYHAFAHLSKFDVTNGQTVKVGDQVGLSGNTGASTGAHLHYGVHTDPSVMSSNSIDPNSYQVGFGTKDGNLNALDDFSDMRDQAMTVDTERIDQVAKDTMKQYGKGVEEYPVDFENNTDDITTSNAELKGYLREELSKMDDRISSVEDSMAIDKRDVNKELERRNRRVDQLYRDRDQIRHELNQTRLEADRKVRQAEEQRDEILKDENSFISKKTEEEKQDLAKKKDDSLWEKINRRFNKDQKVKQPNNKPDQKEIKDINALTSEFEKKIEEAYAMPTNKPEEQPKLEESKPLTRDEIISDLRAKLRTIRENGDKWETHFDPETGRTFRIPLAGDTPVEAPVIVEEEIKSLENKPDKDVSTVKVEDHETKPEETMDEAIRRSRNEIKDLQTKMIIESITEGKKPEEKVEQSKPQDQETKPKETMDEAIRRNRNEVKDIQEKMIFDKINENMKSKDQTPISGIDIGEFKLPIDLGGIFGNKSEDQTGSGGIDLGGFKLPIDLGGIFGNKSEDDTPISGIDLGGINIPGLDLNKVISKTIGTGIDFISGLFGKKKSKDVPTPENKVDQKGIDKIDEVKAGVPKSEEEKKPETPIEEVEKQLTTKKDIRETVTEIINKEEENREKKDVKPPTAPPVKPEESKEEVEKTEEERIRDNIIHGRKDESDFEISKSNKLVEASPEETSSDNDQMLNFLSIIAQNTTKLVELMTGQQSSGNITNTNNITMNANRTNIMNGGQPADDAGFGAAIPILKKLREMGSK